jgi:hypothetical protein
MADAAEVENGRKGKRPLFSPFFFSLFSSAIGPWSNAVAGAR